MRWQALTVLYIAVTGAFAAPLPRRDDPARYESLSREAEEYSKAAENVVVQLPMAARAEGHEAENPAGQPLGLLAAESHHAAPARVLPSRGADRA
jgi:hypothetical protein